MAFRDRRLSLEVLRIEYEALRKEMERMTGDEYRFPFVAGRIAEIEKEFDRRKSA